MAGSVAGSGALVHLGLGFGEMARSVGGRRRGCSG